VFLGDGEWGVVHSESGWLGSEGGKLGRTESDVDAEGDVVAESGPGGVGADFDALDLGGPVLGEEDVVDVVGAIFVVPEIVSRLSLLALGLGKEMMVGAGQAVFLEGAHYRGVISFVAFVVPNSIAVEIAADNGGFADEPLRIVGDGFG
jgi:hypothetical protein